MTELLVLISEEYGYRHHFWYPGMTEVELEKWWNDLESVEPFFFNPAKTLPGKIATVITEEDMERWNSLRESKSFAFIHIHMDDDSFLKFPGKVVEHHKGFDATGAFERLCDTHYMSKNGSLIRIENPNNPCAECECYKICKRKNKQ